MPPFNDSRVSVIESRLETHEKYFIKIDESIEKLSEVSLSIKEMLIKHEGKLEERVLEEEALYEKLEEMKQQSHEEHQELNARIDKVETKVEELTKWRYLVAGGLVIVGLFIGQIIPSFNSIMPAPVLQELVK
jgi:predicted nuclease with TOPRIM domain|tara:strand:+ start:750 stop:1148 length:399 start_codon:yes stop_codon:yes gene_type:complete